MAFPETDAERTWTGIVLAGMGALVGGSIVFPRRVYAGFIWQYFWGPVYADAHNASCTVWSDGARELLTSETACAAATGPVAYPGYTVVSEIGYAITLLVSLLGVIFLLRRRDLATRIRFIYPLIPFMLLGGAIRVVEDATDAVPAGTEAAIQYPWNTLIISPLIYFTVFFITLGSLLCAVWLKRSGRTQTFEIPLTLLGTGFLVLTLGHLSWLAFTTEYVEFHPIFTVLTMVLAIGIAGVLWVGIRKSLPAIARGTPVIGVVILWAHAVDGVSNVLGIDWGKELGLVADMYPKHPVNRAIIGVARNALPESITGVIGAAWTFLLVKLVVATVVIGLFDDVMFEDNPRFSVLLLIAVIAVGLGPGTRDMLRATFGI